MPEGGWLLNSGAATSVGKLIIGVAKVKGIKTINLVRSAAFRCSAGFAVRCIDVTLDSRGISQECVRGQR